MKYGIYINVDIKQDVSLTFVYFPLSPVLTDFTLSGVLIAVSKIFTMCLAYSCVALR